MKIFIDDFFFYEICFNAMCFRCQKTLFVIIKTYFLPSQSVVLRNNSCMYSIQNCSYIFRTKIGTATLDVHVSAIENQRQFSPSTHYRFCWCVALPDIVNITLISHKTQRMTYSVINFIFKSIVIIAPFWCQITLHKKSGQ